MGCITGGGGGGNQPPTASFTTSCAVRVCTFDGSGSTDDVGVVSYAWKNQVGTMLGTGKVFHKTFPEGGPKTIVLIVTDGGGLTGTSTQQFTLP